MDLSQNEWESQLNLMNNSFLLDVRTLEDMMLDTYPMQH